MDYVCCLCDVLGSSKMDCWIVGQDCRAPPTRHGSMVGTVLTIEREIEDALDIRAANTGGKRDDQSSSNSRKRQKTSTSQGFQGQGQDYQDKGHDKAFGQAGQVICYFCRQPGHMRQDCP